jgi:hypothetical protein
MKFGTVEYDLMQKQEPYKRIPFPKKSKDAQKPPVRKDLRRPERKNEKADSSETMAIYPQLPANWVRPSASGDASFDRTAQEIEDKLKRTIVSFSSFYSSHQ